MEDRFTVDTFVQRREVLRSRVWLSMPVRVVADDDVLAVWLAEQTPLTFPPHPFGPHPWSDKQRWTDTGVLLLHRPGDAHAVWGFFHGRQLDHWYINFQAPYRRRADGFDTVDHGVDIVIRGDGWHIRSVAPATPPWTRPRPVRCSCRLGTTDYLGINEGGQQPTPGGCELLARRYLRTDSQGAW